jgi:Tol biopolymer transport system component/tetratricopeptide (TPR) repeat protein
VVDLLLQAARRGEQASRRVSDLFARYGLAMPKASPPPAPPPPPRLADPPPRSSSPSYAPPRSPVGSGGDISQWLSQLTEHYYAGDYQQTIEVANRILAQEPNNPTAQDYRQKSEDNLIRGIVPDHRVPFEARVAYNRANSLVRAGNYEEAAKLYREARELAERSGILSWRDVEQALLDIQDLALARELIAEGDRLMAIDNWGEALRKYEGALRVVPNDPQAEERAEMVRRIQRDADAVSVQMNALSGSLDEQVTQLQNVRQALARVRQLLPASQRLAQAQKELDARLSALKLQLTDQGRAALQRAASATSLEDRLILTNEALRLLDFAIQLDPSDSASSEALLEARAAVGEMNRARQMFDRAAALIAQNFDAELSQARSMLASLIQFAQDERYRAIVNDLFTRYLERAELALIEGDAASAQSWLEAMRDEPFRILGRRMEMYRIEQALRQRRSRQRLLIGGAAMSAVLFCGLMVLVTRPTWEAALFPTATASATPTLTPTFTETPSVTPTPAPTDFPLSAYQLLYAARASDQAQPDLFAIRADGSAEQRLLSQAGQMAFSADGQRLTFIRQQASPLAESTQEADESAFPAVVGEVYLAESANLEAARQVSRLEIASAFSPRLSPDGARIVFHSPYDGDDELWLLDLGTQVVEKLTDNEGIADRDPSWSPDGRQIVFSSDRQSPGLPDLYILTLSQGSDHEVRLLIDNPGSSSAPAWSPDGRWIAYLNDNSGSANVWVVGADGQRNQRVTLSSAEDRAPSWSPDARYIAFASNREEERFQLYLVEWTTRQVRRITQHELDVSAVTFRPDLLLRLRLRP